MISQKPQNQQKFSPSVIRYIYTHTHNTHTCRYTQYIYTHAHIHTQYTYTQTHTHAHTDTANNAYARTCTHIHKYKHTQTHIHVHLQIHYTNAHTVQIQTTHAIFHYDITVEKKKDAIGDFTSSSGQKKKLGEEYKVYLLY